MKWGSWGAAYSTKEYRSMIEACLASGITSFDHADIYGDYTTEADFGKALGEIKNRRQQLQLITKCGICMVVPNRPAFRIKSYNTSRDYIIACAEQSLVNLQTDYIDALLIHRPDPLMDPEAIAAAFTVLKASGKVLHFGVSNFTPSQVALVHSFFPLEINQLEVSVTALDPFHNGQLDQCIERNILPMAWGPLGSGVIFSKERDERSERILNVATSLAEQYQTSPDCIILAFLHRHPAGILPVLGTAKAERLEQAMRHASIRLSSEEWFMLWRASTGHDVP